MYSVKEKGQLINIQLYKGVLKLYKEVQLSQETLSENKNILCLVRFLKVSQLIYHILLVQTNILVASHFNNIPSNFPWVYVVF